MEACGIIEIVNIEVEHAHLREKRRTSGFGVQAEVDDPSRMVDDYRGRAFSAEDADSGDREKAIQAAARLDETIAGEGRG